jgi:hypothetical protein
MRATCPANFVLLVLKARQVFGEAYKLWSYSLCSLLQPLATSFPLGLTILLNTLFSNTLNLCSSFSVREQVSYPYKTTAKIIVLNTLISNFLGRRREGKRTWSEL